MQTIVRHRYRNTTVSPKERGGQVVPNEFSCRVHYGRTARHVTFNAVPQASVFATIDGVLTNVDDYWG